MPPLHAILTGDLIGSTEAGSEVLQTSMFILANTAQIIGNWSPSTDANFTRSRGDAWQMVVHDPGHSLRAVLLLQARLRAWPEGLATRISIGIGRVDSLGTDNLADASGPAFIESGQGLDRIGRIQRLAITFDKQTPFQQAIPFQQGLIALADELARRWTREQAEAVALALQPHNPTLEEMGQSLAISKQAVNYRLTGAGLRAIRLALRAWEDGFDMQVEEEA